MSIHTTIKRRLCCCRIPKKSSTDVPHKTQPATTALGTSQPNKPSLQSSGVNNSLLAMESDIIPFGAPDPDKPTDEPDAVPFGPDPKEELKVDEDEVNEDGINRDIDGTHVKHADKNGEVQANDDARFEMCLAG
jgi:hypothetical protein